MNESSILTKLQCCLTRKHVKETLVSGSERNTEAPLNGGGGGESVAKEIDPPGTLAQEFRVFYVYINLHIFDPLFFYTSGSEVHVAYIR